MFRIYHLAIVFPLLLANLVCGQTAQQILTSNTKAFVSIPDVREFESRFDQTLMGQLAADPVMQPFAKDMQRQIRERLIQSNLNIQVDWAQIQNACGKELALASVQPRSGEGQAAVLIMDTTGREEEAAAMKQAFAEKLKSRGAKRSTVDVSGQTLVVNQLPREKGKLLADTVAQFTFSNRLVICNHVAVAERLLTRMINQQYDESLESLPAFRQTVERCAKEDQNATAQVRWFIEPFGLIRMLKRSQLNIGSNENEYLDMFAAQGFDAVQAVGGVMYLATGTHEMLHRTFVYAPPVTGTEPGEKYTLAARMLDFPNDDQWNVPNWVPRDVATYMSMRWKTAEAFEHVGSLVDAMAGSENYFEGFLSSLRDDQNGPRLDIREEFVAYLGDEIQVFTDQVLPVTTASERLLAAIRLTDSQAVAKTFLKLKGDREFKLHRYGDLDVWEYRSSQDDEFAPPEAILDLDEIDLGPPPVQVSEDDPQILANTSFTVAHGYLLISTHMSLLEEVINAGPDSDSLGQAADFERIRNMLVDVGAGKDACRFFARTDEEYRTNYELLRQGKMPESESFLGRVLNRILGEPNRDILRSQELDGKNLPEFQTVRRYFGPAGLYMQSEDDGWFICGILVSKHNDAPASEGLQSRE